MEITVKKISVPKGRRILAVSDIHGQWPFLEHLLEQTNFCDDDLLFIIGDIIEKGYENLASLRYVMDLARRDNVTVLVGNVDLLRLQMLENLSEDNCGKFYGYLLKMREWRGTSIFDEMAAELGLALDSPEQALASRPALLESFRKELDFIRGLPAIAETENYIFDHGGLPSEDLEAVKAGNIRDVLKFDNFMGSGLSFHKYVIVGHYPVSIYNQKIMQKNPLIDRGRHIISIDGGCGLQRDGQLNMLIIPEPDCETDKITWMSWDDLPVFRALTAQEESEDPVNIEYLNRKIRILEEGEEFSRVEHADSGRRMKILTKSIYNRDGQWACARHTDYLLPVRAGDRLSVIDETSDGYFVKKDGVCGWYKGRF